MNDFPKRLTIARKMANMSQKALADASYVNACTINKWEHGVATPNFYNMAIIAKILNVSLDYLAFGGEYRCVNNIEK